MKICIIAPDPQALYNRFSESHKKESPNTPAILFGLDIKEKGGSIQAVGFLSNHNPDYVLIGLDSFDKNNCRSEQEVSMYLKDRNIPTHFLLSSQLGIPNPVAIQISMETEIFDLWSNPTTGQEFYKQIKDFINLFQEPEQSHSASAGDTSSRCYIM